ncbi:uncharacterized protein LOC128312378 isoform X1 [Acinonyx jubatus]|uniref:Uncharacterized protein LOC128312378 isoform X1 n=1 Tax=Acinonyx jubatus TaxID=32536 RepID=A0ABM3NQZ2_ACIJB|nr:uncharacterized protein LOC128312378 isoform X1 [Acinonyx jubatus]XP_053061841.1 uncharacterized protein LOC128312378 isoform X1 [Acinonyx jubatus]
MSWASAPPRPTAASLSEFQRPLSFPGFGVPPSRAPLAAPGGEGTLFPALFLAEGSLCCFRPQGTEDTGPDLWPSKIARGVARLFPTRLSAQVSQCTGGPFSGLGPDCVGALAASASQECKPCTRFPTNPRYLEAYFLPRQEDWVPCGRAASWEGPRRFRCPGWDNYPSGAQAQASAHLRGVIRNSSCFVLFFMQEIAAVGLNSPAELPGAEFGPRTPGPNGLSPGSAGSPQMRLPPRRAQGARRSGGPFKIRPRMWLRVRADPEPCAHPAPLGAGTWRRAHPRGRPPARREQLRSTERPCPAAPRAPRGGGGAVVPQNAARVDAAASSCSRFRPSSGRARGATKTASQVAFPEAEPREPLGGRPPARPPLPPKPQRQGQ